MNLENLITQYYPSDAAIEVVHTTKIVLLVGISGAGKDTIKHQLLKSPDYSDIISHTTRAPRMNNGIMETPDIDYHFIQEDKAVHMLENHEFIEAKFVHGTVYGTSVAEVAKARENNQIAITDIDVQGVDEYKELSQNVIAIFILPPSYDEWRRRLAARYQTPEEFEAEWPKRRASAITELTHALEVPYYHVIINDDLDTAVAATDKIAHKPDVYTRKDDEARLAARDLLESIIAHS